MPQISIQGKSIHFQEGEKFEKSRPTLLFVHGAGQRAYTWRFQEDLFRNHPKFNYMALDLPGRAGSEGEGFHTLEEYKNFLLEFIDALELNNIILVGHSMGGGISMLLAIEHPELVEALILVATSAKLSVASETLEKVKDNYEEFYEISPTRAFAEESPKELKDEYQQGLIDTGSAVCYGDLMACNVFDIMKEVEIQLSFLEVKDCHPLAQVTIDQAIPILGMLFCFKKRRDLNQKIIMRKFRNNLKKEICSLMKKQRN